MEIRVMKEEDLEDLIRIDEEYTGKRREVYYKRLVDELLSPKYKIVNSLVAEENGKVIGFIAGMILSGEFGIPEDVAYITTIGVDKKYTRRGVGKELLMQFIINARAAGVNKIYTIVDWESRDLLNFFGKNGFIPSTSLNLEYKI